MPAWLVRHGESTWNRERRFQGARDAELFGRGRAQARALAAALDGPEREAISASPLARARETAATRGARRAVAAVVPDDLREVGLGLAAPAGAP